jgi:two-component system, LytTR family, sensor kinase
MTKLSFKDTPFAMKPIANRKITQVLMHTVVWLIVFAIPYLFRSHYNENRPANPDDLHFIILNTITEFFWILLFYLNVGWLVPRFLFRRKYLIYGLILIGIFAVILGIHVGLFSILIRFRKVNLWASTGFNLPAFLLTIAVSTTYRFLSDQSKREKMELERQEQNLKTEVSFLRSQISPHFIFNVLNNLVALVRMKSDQLEPTIMKLSGLMQYMLYETDDDKVILKDEADYLQNYIDLQQQRFGSKVKLDVSLKLPEKNYQIEPMLLIPFVENAFKHGVGLIENPEIVIDLHEENGRIVFHVRNKFNDLKQEVKDKSAGIGLQNVARRLDLLYPGKHKLTVSKAGNVFDILLYLNLF